MRRIMNWERERRGAGAREITETRMQATGESNTI
jgi:hypothetical protein